MFWVTLFIQIISLLFCFASIKKLYGYIKVYRFKEKDYKLLIGFIHLRQVVVLYILSAFVLSFAALSTYLYILR